MEPLLFQRIGSMLMRGIILITSDEEQYELSASYGVCIVNLK
jgi:acyl transferase domain-containing protein